MFIYVLNSLLFHVLLQWYDDVQKYGDTKTTIENTKNREP